MRLVHGVIPLARAALCLNDPCDTLFHVADGQCPVCASEHFAPLAVWLPTTMAAAPDGR